MSAVISDCGTYRYELMRIWDDRPLLEFIMLNPSTADADIDDPTIRRCIAFAKKWGHGGVIVRNLYALRATDPKELLAHADPYGPRNSEFLAEMLFVGKTLAAWGTNPATRTDSAIATIECLKIARPALYCLGTTKDGSPKHPLYVKSSQELLPWPEVS